MANDPRPRQRDDRRRASCSTPSASATSEGDARFLVVVPAEPPAPRQRHLRRGGARLRPGARRPRARVHARGGHRGHRRGRRRGPVQRRDGRDRRARHRRDHRLHAARRPRRAGCGATCPSASRARPACRSSTSWSTSTTRACRSTSRSWSPTRPPRGGELRRARSRSSPRRGRGASSSSCPQDSRRRPRRRARRASACAQLLESLRADGIVAAGMIGDPDPYTAAMNALQYFRISEIVISTLPANRSELAARRPGRAQSRRQPASPSSTSSRRDEPRRRPDGSRLDRTPATRHDDARAPRPARGQPLLARRAAAARDAAFHHLGDHGLRGLLHGLLLHPGRGRRRVAGRGHRAAEADRRRQHGDPAVAPRSRMHWALESAKTDNRFGLQGGHPHDLPARRDVPLHPDQRVRPHRLRARRTTRRARSSTASPACTAPTSSSASRCWLFTTIRAFRGHFTPEEHRGVEVPGIYWHFVDVMWIVVYLRSTSSERRAQPAALRGGGVPLPALRRAWSRS